MLGKVAKQIKDLNYPEIYSVNVANRRKDLTLGGEESMNVTENEMKYIANPKRGAHYKLMSSLLLNYFTIS